MSGRWSKRFGGAKAPDPRPEPPPAPQGGLGAVLAPTEQAWAWSAELSRAQAAPA